MNGSQEDSREHVGTVVTHRKECMLKVMYDIPRHVVRGLTSGGKLVGGSRDEGYDMCHGRVHATEAVGRPVNESDQ